MSDASSTAGAFTQGSTLRHIVVLTSTSAFGLFAIMAVDFLDLLYIKALGTTETAAAIGFAGNVLFYLTSINIGISIAAGVFVARALGAGDRDKASCIVSDFFAVSFTLMLLVAILAWWQTPNILIALGASGEALELATAYLRIMWWSAPLFVLGFVGMSTLRSAGDARRSMNCTLVVALVNAVLDPLLIFDRPLAALGVDASFGLGLGVEGAAWASLMARFAMVAVALHGTIVTHQLFVPIDLRRCINRLSSMASIAVPAMLTNFATPVGDSFVTRAMAQFGDEAVSAYAVIGRIIAIGFSVTFALSGAVGPILAQNLGAQSFDRVQRVVRQSLVFAVVYVVVVSLILLGLENPILRLFNSSGDEAQLIIFFLHYISFGFCFVAILFVTNAGFNNMGKPTWATGLNFLRALGAIPAIFWAAGVFGPRGILAAQSLWTVVVTLLAIWLMFRLLAQVSCGEEKLVAAKRRHTLWRLPVFNYGCAKPPAFDTYDSYQEQKMPAESGSPEPVYTDKQ